MERRFAVRKREMLTECEVSERVFRGMAQRLSVFGGRGFPLLPIPLRSLRLRMSSRGG